MAFARAYNRWMPSQGIAIALVSVCALASCGSGGAGSDCRSSADCGDGLGCSGAGDPQVCGIAPREACATDLDCSPTNDRCHAIFDSCSFDGIGSECRAACTADLDCGGAGVFRCDAGACIAITCDQGFSCGAREVCDVTRITSNTPIYDRHHGCFAVTCSTDAECGDGFCVNGSCQDALGTCVEPMLVP